MNISKTIFRSYDIRGISGEDLSEEVYYYLGRAYATFLYQRRIKECVVGHDNRLTSESYSKSFIKGLNEGGIDTIFVGYSVSPMIYFSSYEFKTKGGAMITASHNPKEHNGLKLGVGYSDTMLGDEVQQIRALVESENFSKGEGKNRNADLFTPYKKEILKYFNLNKKWKVVIDTCNSTPGLFYPDIFRSAGCEVIEQNTNLDGNFPLGDPDPTEQTALERLAEGVKKAQADIGFAYDSDGDRMAVVDEKGNVLWMDTIISLFIKDVLDFIPGSKIVFNNLCSKQVSETIKSCGGEPVMWITGHSFIKAKIKEVRSPFGGELSGHIFFMDNFYGNDDAIYASLRLLQYLERINQTLSEAVATLPKYVSSPEIKLGIPEEVKFKIVDEEIKSDFVKKWPNAEFNYMEGVRMDEKDKMAVVRASQNGGYLTVKFEGSTQEIYDQVKKDVSEILHKYEEINWEKGTNIHALD